MPNRLEGGPELLDGMWDLPGSQAVALLVKASPALLVALVAQVPAGRWGTSAPCRASLVRSMESSVPFCITIV